MEVHSIRTPGLGDATYILVHDGQVVVADPQRDIDRFQSVIEASGGEVRFVLETHVHNDYVSGGRDLAREVGAELVFPAGAAPVFRHRPAFHNEDIAGGALTIRPLHTPGHTPEHTSYLVLADGEESIVFSGGSLLTGSAGRSDLLGLERAESLARLQYGSIHRLAALPDATRLCPTHGAGSFCTAAPAGRDTSTIGEERQSNPVFSHPDVDSFVASQLGGLPAYPSYYRHMGPMNLTGPSGPPTLRAPIIAAGDLHSMIDDVMVIDARPIEEYATGHIPGSLSVELSRSFGVWVGWLVEFEKPLALVLSPSQDAGEALRQLTRIGYDDIRGMVNSLDGWPGELEKIGVAGVSDFADAVERGEQILDTRAPSEWNGGTIPGSLLVYVPDVLGVGDMIDPDRPVWVVCESGFRASIAASLLATRGYRTVVLSGAGVDDVQRRMTEDG